MEELRKQVKIDDQATVDHHYRSRVGNPPPATHTQFPEIRLEEVEEREREEEPEVQERQVADELFTEHRNSMPQQTIQEGGVTTLQPTPVVPMVSGRLVNGRFVAGVPMQRLDNLNDLPALEDDEEVTLAFGQVMVLNEQSMDSGETIQEGGVDEEDQEPIWDPPVWQPPKRTWEHCWMKRRLIEDLNDEFRDEFQVLDEDDEYEED